jgi:hypothetical protein
VRVQLKDYYFVDFVTAFYCRYKLTEFEVYAGRAELLIHHANGEVLKVTLHPVANPAPLKAGPLSARQPDLGPTPVTRRRSNSTGPEVFEAGEHEYLLKGQGLWHKTKVRDLRIYAIAPATEGL